MRAYQLMADVSSNNGHVDVPTYSRAGHVVMAIKATQGTGYVNPGHFDQSRVAHDFGLTVVHYHYCDRGNSIEQEIAHFRNHYNKVWRNGDYACFDIEVPGLDTHYANSLLREYFNKTRREPILYTYRDFAEHNLSGVTVPGKRVWLADYSSHPVHLPKRYTLWARQYTDGSEGPEPHFYSGIGKCDGSAVTAGVARALWLRKLHTRRRK